MYVVEAEGRESMSWQNEHKNIFSMDCEQFIVQIMFVCLQTLTSIDILVKCFMKVLGINMNMM